MNKIAIIGSGFSGLSAACFLAKNKREVTVYEKNNSIGGRATSYSEQGFTFDMGPSWYWMPDIFEKFFAHFGKTTSDYYRLVRLDPGFQIIFGKNDVLKVPAKIDAIYDMFESIEKGSANKLKKFLEEGAYKYRVGMNELVYKPSYSWLELAKLRIIRDAPGLHMFTSLRNYVRTFFKDERLIALMEFPVLFLGATAKQIPALYSLMNYTALAQGTWYPMGGMIEIVKAMESLALARDVKFIINCDVKKIDISHNRVNKLVTSKGIFSADGLIASGDYHHIEQDLLDKEYRNYNEAYWNKRTLAPSSLIFYVGVNKKIEKLIHHNLFFDAPINEHAEEIYTIPRWPENPLFYVCCPSITDSGVAPQGMENLFILIPIAPGLDDTNDIREHYFDIVIKRMEQLCGQNIKDHIIYKRSYCKNDFINDYHAYKGNAYGLANTLRQTAVLKPTLKNLKVKNFFYAGQLTVPGPGVPPALISGQIAAEQLLKHFK